MAAQRSSFENSLIHVIFDGETSPDLYCPVTRKLIVPGTVNFEPTSSGDKINYADIETVMFVFLADEPVYVSENVEAAIDERRAALEKAGDIEDADDLSEFDVVSEHLPLGPAAMIFKVVWDGSDDTAVIVGLDLAATVTRCK